VVISASANNIIGAKVPGPDNVISANKMDGILITGAASTGNKVQGNYIGTSVTGAAPLGNAFYGVEINAAPTNVIGVGPGLDNLISANGKDGVYITGATATGNKLAGDYIGTDWTGMLALGNSGNGVQIDSASGNYIGVGSAVSGPDNVISGNMKDGVLITGATASGNQLVADYIGTDKAGSTALGNNWNGVEVVGASDTAIGGPDEGGLEPLFPFKNIISANGKVGGAAKGFGVLFEAAAGGFVRNSALGTDKTGTKSLPNANGGVAVIYGSTKVRVGSAVAGNGNLISGNRGPGVLITNSDLMGHDADTTNNTVLGNYIGTDVGGTSALSNSGSGVVVEDGASANTIGGTTAATRNLISGNGEDGVLFANAGGTDYTTGNVVQGDYIGTDKTGDPVIPNTGNGVEINISSYVTVKNSVLSGNILDGLLIIGLSAVSNKVQNNKIGTDVTGHTTAPNGKNGVEILLGSGNVIGGSKSKRNIISGNRGFGVRIAGLGARANTVHNNYIGTDASGYAPLPNIDNGVEIAGGATLNFIGGALGVDGNVIAGNTNVGVRITDPGTTGNVVQGNYIGTDKTGKKALGNTSNGVQITFGATGNVIGGATVVRNTRRGSKTFLLGNIIAGNGGDGVRINEPGTAGNMVQGNKIGTDKTGTVAIANKFHGVEIFNKASGNLIGGMGKTANVIAGNGGDGVYIANAGTMGNVVQGNFIGTDKRGMMALGNGGHGVELALGTSSNTIGGTTTGAGNVISGNAKDGVLLAGDDLVLSTFDLVQGNFIGTDKTGTTTVDPTGKRLGNGGYGVEIAAVSANTIGGTTAGAGNVISGNGVTMSAATAKAGVRIAGDAKVAASGNLVQGNFIGTNKAGTATVDSAGNLLGNGTDGIDVVGGATANTIGGTAAGAGNTISGNGTALFTGNTMDGVLLSGAGTKANVVQGNTIGTDKTGAMAFDSAGNPLGNGGNGVAILSGASTNTIGGTASGAGNTISGNGSTGVSLSGSGTTGNLVLGNTIGTDRTGTMIVDANGNPLSNGGDGVDVAGSATANTIGGTTAAAANIVGGNTGAGLLLSGAGTTSNVVQGNFIGTDGSGTLALSNGGDGIDLVSGAAGNTIGGTVAGAGNTIAYNVGVGVVVGSSPADSTTTGNGILGNSIFANALGIDLGNDGVTPNDPMNPDIGPNKWQNYPVLGSAVSSGGTTTITGTLDSALSTTFRIEFFDNVAADPTGYGQGQTYLGFLMVMTDSMGHGVISMMLPVAVPVGDCVAATATDPGNNTSEFSLCVTVTAGTAPSSGTDPRFSRLRMEDLALPPYPMSVFGLSSPQSFDSLKANSVEAYPQSLDFFFQAFGQNVPEGRGQRTEGRGQGTADGTRAWDWDFLFDPGLEWLASL
jgi:hypothetical protein